jgi:rhodanese-related sulfurtransferase
MNSEETAGNGVIDRIEAVRPQVVYEVMRRRQNVRIIDVSRGLDYDIGHIPGAMSMPPETWGDCAGLSEKDMNILYCHSAQSGEAMTAAEGFAEKGYKVAVLEGGFESWVERGLPLSTS